MPQVQVRARCVIPGDHLVRHSRSNRIQWFGQRTDRRVEVPKSPPPRRTPRESAQPSARCHPDRCHHLGAHQPFQGSWSWVRPGRTAGSRARRAVAQTVSADALSAPRRHPDRTEQGQPTDRAGVRHPAGRTFASVAVCDPRTTGPRRRRRRDHRIHPARSPGGAPRGGCAFGGDGCRCRHAGHLAPFEGIPVGPSSIQSGQPFDGGNGGCGIRVDDHAVHTQCVGCRDVGGNVVQECRSPGRCAQSGEGQLVDGRVGLA